MISTTFLSDIAAYTMERVSKVVLNGSYVITKFKYEGVSGDTLTLQYLIPTGQIETVSRIELQDKNGQVLSANDVHIPIKADTMLLQTIQVKEALNK